MMSLRWVCLILGVLGVTLMAAQNQQQEPTLRHAAEARGKLIGFAMARGAVRKGEKAYLDTAAREFNVIVAENSMKFGLVCPKARGVYDFNDADAIVEFAHTNGMKVRGHALLWHNQQPKWLAEDEWTKQEMTDIVGENITTMLGRYKGKVYAWDVVNEAISDSNDANDVYRKTNYYDAIGSEYIDLAFKLARGADPNAKLFYNDYGCDFGGIKFEKMFNMVKGMKERGIPIDGVGFQMHLGFYAEGQSAKMVECFRRLKELGLEVQITEMDVAVELPCDGTKLQKQAEIYRQIVEAACKESNCTAILLWGFTDKHSWIPGFSQGKNGCALLFDENYKPKPAYSAVLDALKDK